MPPELLLASASPRRTALLTQIGIRHQIKAVDIDESPLASELPAQQVVRLAQQKASTAFNLLSEEDKTKTVVLASDTLIELDNVSLGKPANQEECIAMLTALSGREHQVLTAICVCSASVTKSQCINTKVQFAHLTLTEMVTYWQSGEPADKAGSYAIQGIGGQFVKSVNGSVSAVIGLPLYETKQLLKEFGVTP
ncbi:Maf family nucleotide pyrophosphatase [Alteromonas ponticola]|uniref:dTTP/UTP pyrophosphatase n=1 Tax=Alteromonas aquimaris TaxID=2998417 RepID=A0ABT3PB86_9ALTE|nr:Maf family protein [Alteromonas aquimaris]MCW8109830.1 Maf family nucleotide pyrophosphatase [Alteromonas aquimaris]